METFRAPAPVDLQGGNVAESWRKWKRQFNVYFTACEIQKKDKDTQVAVLLHAAGPEALEVSETFQWSAEEDKTDYKVWLTKFDEHCEPRKNIVFERYQFWTRDQLESESIDTWLTDLRMSAKRCEFTGHEEAMLRDKLVFGVRNNATRERLLREPNLTLAKGLEICRATEASRKQAQAMGSSSNSSHETEVNLVRKFRHGSAKDLKKPSQSNFITSCKFCGKSHERGNCPAFGKFCANCGRRNHDVSVCTASSQPQRTEKKKFYPKYKQEI